MGGVAVTLIRRQNPAVGIDDGMLDTEDVAALEARLADLEAQIRERRLAVANLTATAGMLDRMPRISRDGVSSFGVGILRGLIADVALFVVFFISFLVRTR